MPYGNRSKTEYQGVYYYNPIDVPWRNYWVYNNVLVSTNSSSGSNVNVPFKRTKPVYKMVPVRVPIRNKLAPKIREIKWDPKRKRLYWKRESPLTYIIKYRRSKVGLKGIRGLDLAPNTLSSESLNITPFGPSIIRARWREYYWNGTFTEYERYHASNYSLGHLWWSHPQGPPEDRFYDSARYAGFQVDIAEESAAINEIAKHNIAKLRDKVGDHSVNIAQAVAERTQTARMASELVSRAAQSLVALKKGNVAKAASKLFPTDTKQLANDWLVIQYGIRPLLSDIDGLAKQLADPLAARDYVDFTVSGRRNGTFHAQKSTSGRICQTSTLDIQWEVIVKTKIRIRIDDPFRKELSSLGITNPALLAWELIPYSFVVDWLLPIGDYLQSVDSFAGVTVIYAHQTVVRKRKSAGIASIGGVDSDGWNWDSNKLGWYSEASKIERSFLNAGDFKAPFPSFKNPISTGHLLNAAALLRQLR